MAHTRRALGAQTNPLKDRQLTMGECIALARYGEAVGATPDVGVRLTELLLFIDSIEVCTTCGWSRRIHELLGSSQHVIGCCEHWTRDL